MLNFEDLLKQDLPSKGSADPTLEGVRCEDEDNDIDREDSVLDNLDDEVEQDLDDIDISGIDPDDVSEDDLVAIDSDSYDDEEELDDDEAVEADQLMGLVATPMLLDKELTEESVEEFVNELPMAISEGFLLESDIDSFLGTNTDDLYVEKRVFAPTTKVMLNEKDRRKQLFEIGVQASARAHNDPTYWKLQKCYKLERQYKAKLRQKYRGEALKRVKAYVKRLKSSSSKILSGLGNKITGGK